MTTGLQLKSSITTSGKVTIQPKPATSATNAVAPTNLKAMVTNLVTTSKPAFVFTQFDFLTVKSALPMPVDTRYNDELPRSKSKFSPFEEIANIAATRPEILYVSEFKPIFTNDGYGFTAAGEFIDAQVKLMNLRREAMTTLINDLKENPELAKQLDQIEGDFLKHVTNLKSHVDFLTTLQTYIDNVSKLLDMRGGQSITNAAAVLNIFYNSVFSNVAEAASTLSSCTYVDLLSQHGFNKSNVAEFSSSKIFLQTLFEAKKTLRAGSDELLGSDPSLTSRDSDPVMLNKRRYQDPHKTLELARITTFNDVHKLGIHESDTRLTSLLQRLENNIRAIDNAFSNATSEEIRYTLKLRTLAREIAYSHALSNTTVINLLGEYGYPIRTDVGNHELFDAVYGQLGTRITDDHTGANSNSVSSMASRVDGDRAVLTFEIDNLEDEQGSVFTPGALYYVASAIRPNNSNAFSHERAADLVTRMGPVLSHYVNFVGNFNLLPRTRNVVLNKLGSMMFALDPVEMTNALYEIFVEKSTGYLKSDVVSNSIVDFMCEAATDANLRANLLMFINAVANVSGDGLVSIGDIMGLGGIVSGLSSLNDETKQKVAQAEKQNTLVSATVNKLISNCVTRYKSITNDAAGATKVEYALKNFNEQGPLSRMIAYLKQCYNVYTTVSNASYTRYSHLSDMHMIALGMQTVLDTARRYAYNRLRINNAVQINSNFALASKLQLTLTKGNSPTQKKSSATSVFTLPKPVASLAISNNISKLPLKQAVVARLEREELLVIQTTLAPLNIMRLVRDNVKEFVLYLQKKENTSALNNILKIVEDNKLVELLADRGQVRLLSDTVNTILDKISQNPGNTTTDLSDIVSLTRNGSFDDDLKIFDDSYVTSKTANILKAAFSSAKFSPDRGSNIKVIAFGLPHGFSTHLENTFKVTTFAEQTRSKRKQNDVVVADVYKVDVRYPDLVFKPIPKIFELSRFAIRDENQFAFVQVGASLEMVLDAIPTKDYSNFSNVTIAKGANTNTFADMHAQSYDFMTVADIADMLRNTTMSYLHEIYCRLLTGIPVSERELYVQDPDEQDRPAPFITSAILQNIVGDAFQVPQSPVQNSIPLDYKAFLNARPVFSTLRASNSTFARVSALLNNPPAVASVASQTAQASTVYIDKEMAAKRLMSPKLFERVFFVDVDPDDFEIDRDETFKSEAGKSTFAQLEQAKEILFDAEMVARLQREAYYLRDHKLEKQMTFEKYFVVVRAYSPLPTRGR